MKREILTILHDTDGHVSGQQLCEQLNVSRTAIWKVMEQLKAEGYQIEAIRNKGYRLIESPDILSKAEIESMLETKWAGKPVQFFAETDSTNLQAKKLGEDAGVHGSLCVADYQTAGRGRRGREWECEPGESIYMSILLRPDMKPDKAPMLTLVMAQSVAEGIKDVTGEETFIKWPNDIVMSNKKICGILTEMSAEVDYIHHVVIGAGINVNMEHFPEELKEKATSLRLETEKTYRRVELIAAVMKRFEQYYEAFMETEDLSGIQDIYNKRLINRGRQVRVLEPGHEFDGLAIGINETGNLLVETEDGSVTEIFAGEVSVRGIYGYV